MYTICFVYFERDFFEFLLIVYKIFCKFGAYLIFNIMFSKETYISRRDALKKSIKSGLLLFLGNEEQGYNYADNSFNFRQDSSFLYYFGLPYAGLNAVIDIDNDREIIFGDELTIDHIVWMGNQPTLAEKASSVGIAETRPAKDLQKVLDMAVNGGREIHYLPTYRSENQIKLFNLLGVHPGLEETIRRLYPRCGQYA